MGSSGNSGSSIDSRFQIAKKTVDQIIQSQITLINDSDLKFTDVIIGRYRLELRWKFSSGVTPLLKWALSTAGGAATFLSGSWNSTSPATNNSALVARNTTTNGNDQWLFIEIEIDLTVQGDIVLQWAQQVSTASDTKSIAGSNAVLVKL